MKQPRRRRWAQWRGQRRLRSVIDHTGSGAAYARDLREATLARGMNHGSESGRNVPPRPAPLTFTFQCGATDGGAAERARHSHGARGPQRRRAILRRALTAPNTAQPRITVIPVTTQCKGFSFSDNRGESRNRVTDKRCATVARGTRARPRTLPQEACRKWESGASAGKPPRATHTHPGSPR